MSTIGRRSFLGGAAAASLAWALGAERTTVAAAEGLRLATFRLDVTPPPGHSLCGGWIPAVAAVDDELEALGVVLLGAGRPIVICSVDWTGILNSAHLAWRRALAEAAGTTPDRVAVQCVHQHDAPFACLDAQRIVARHGDLPDIVSPVFLESCLERARKAVAACLDDARPVDAVSVGRGRVDRVASNRRILGPDGKVLHWRGSSSRNPLHHELPEGLIDPWLRTVAFHHGDRRLAAFHYYATHPMSHYGKGRVSSDFCGLARKARQKADPECLHVYFTGCAGNIAAGKYNDGSPERRPELSARVLAGMVEAEARAERRPVGRIAWRSVEVLPPGRSSFVAETLAREIADSTRSVVNRNRPAYTLAWLERVAAGGPPITVSALHIGNVSLVHLPSECFVEYQLRAQRLAGARFVATAAYGDGGPWYIPTRDAYPQGGYEVSVAFCAPEVDDILDRALERLLLKPFEAGE